MSDKFYVVLERPQEFANGLFFSSAPPQPIAAGGAIVLDVLNVGEPIWHRPQRDAARRQESEGCKGAYRLKHVAPTVPMRQYQVLPTVRAY
jgi:hypothetical protein